MFFKHVVIIKKKVIINVIFIIKQTGRTELLFSPIFPACLECFAHKTAIDETQNLEEKQYLIIYHRLHKQYQSICFNSLIIFRGKTLC